MSAMMFRAPSRLYSASRLSSSWRLRMQIIVSQLCTKAKGTEDALKGSESADSTKVRETEDSSMIHTEGSSTRQQPEIGLIVNEARSSLLTTERNDDAELQPDTSKRPKKKKLKSKKPKAKEEDTGKFSLIQGFSNVWLEIVGKYNEIIGSIKQFIADWKEMEENMQPQPDPPGTKPKLYTWANLRKLPWGTWRLILTEAVTLHYYIMTDHVKAHAILDEDERLMTAFDEEIRKEEEEKLKKENEGIDTSLVVSDTKEMDIHQLLDKLKLIASPTFVEDAKKITGVDDAIKFAKEHRVEGLQQLEKIAADRMEVMGDVIQEFMVGYKEGKETAFKEASTDEEYLNKIVQPIYSILKEKAIELKEEMENQEDPNKKELTEEEELEQIKKDHEKFLRELDAEGFPTEEEDRLAVEKIKADANELFKDYYTEEEEEENRLEIERKLKEAETEYYGGEDNEEREKLKELREIEQVKIDAELSYQKFFGGDLSEEVKELIKQKKIRREGGGEKGELMDSKGAKGSKRSDYDDEDDDEEGDNLNRIDSSGLSQAEVEKLEVEQITIDAALSYQKYFGGGLEEHIKEMIKKKKIREEGGGGNTKSNAKNREIVTTNSSEEEEDEYEDDDEEYDGRKKPKLSEAEVEKREVEQITINAALSYEKYFGGALDEHIKELIKKKKIRDDNERIEEENASTENGNSLLELDTRENNSIEIEEKSEMTRQDEDKGNDDNNDKTLHSKGNKKELTTYELSKIDAELSYQSFFGGDLSEEVKELIKKQKIGEKE